METHGKNVPNSLLNPTLNKNNMNIQLWYSEQVSRWRWTLTCGRDEYIMESGDSKDLELAMNDVAKTVQWIKERQCDHWSHG